MPPKPDPVPVFMGRFQDFLDADRHAESLPRLDECLELLQEVRDRELLDAIAHGDTHAELAAAIGVSRQAITQQLASARARELRRAERRRGHGGGS